ncbi:MAG: deoxynucleoside kinase [Caulobacteraceae bacterium]|nr:deoxynucleoside kinase [Caulobacteraceae bacterium]
MYIAVSGNLGSGKTTVARGLAKAFACDVYPRGSYNRSYIEDLFREPKRWTTEAQISFMVHKHDEVRRALNSGRFFVLDRTFDEEVEVFAERFHDDGTIDNRSIELIRRIAADLRLRINPPDLIVYCDCPAAIAAERLILRPRSYQADYPPEHLEMLEARLRGWLEHQSTPVISVDTATIDYRDETNTVALAHSIDTRLTQTAPNQFDLFGALADGTPNVARSSLLRKRQVYLAAPFTARARTRGGPGARNLFDTEGLPDQIPTSYRRRLTGLAQAIEGHGHEVLLPHRDINRWGKRSLPGSEVARRCLAAVADADCFVGLIAESFGSHAELGYALGLGKPSLILVSSGDATSFFGQGMSALPNVSVLRAGSVTGLAKMLRESDPLARMTWSEP